MTAIHQKVVVQMLEIPPNNQSNSLRSSLRSSSAKRPNSENSKNDSSSKNQKSEVFSNNESKVKDEDEEAQNVPRIIDDKPSEIAKVGAVEAALEDVKETLTPLTISTPEKAASESQLCSPTNSSLISPTSNSNVPKKKKKLNDCIAMLTCKIQEKLGVSFFDQLAPSEAVAPEKTSTCVSPVLVQEQKLIETKPSTSFQIESLLKENTFALPVQDEVIDLSIKKKPATVEEPKAEIVKEVEVKAEIERPREVSHQADLESKAVEAPVVPIQSESKLETIETEIPETKSKELEVLPELQPLPQIAEETKVETKEIPPEIIAIETCDVESFKISIPKEKIPNLKEILDQYQVITVNNIKISESERRAFEEQKNRILQILNKTNSLTRKITNRKTNMKKAVKRKAPARKSPHKKNSNKKPEAAKPKPEAVVIQKDVEASNEKVETKIEEVIKTTNRIRCRRLSVVVDPIINLSAFQNTNRKMRLTNNSQQNGFYELLTASEQFFTSDKTVEKTKIETNEKSAEESEEKSEDVAVKTLPAEASIVESEVKEIVFSTKTRAAKSNAKELNKKIVSEKVNEIRKPANMSPPKPKGKASNKKPAATEAVEEIEEKPLEEKPLEAPKVTSTLKKGKTKKQNVENISSPADPAEGILVEAETKTINEIIDQSKEKAKVSPKKSNAKNKKKNVLPLEEIKDDQSIKVKLKSLPERRRKTLRGKPLTKEENLDISFSSDTSNENDIPLAQLMLPVNDQVATRENANEVEKIEEVKVVEEIEFKVDEEDLKIDDVADILTDDESEDEMRKLDDELIIDEEEPITEPPEVDEKPAVDALENSTKEEIPLEKLQPLLSKTSSTLELSEASEVETRKSFNPFTINEDSFFNDDLDNDPSDKINDIVNNIINSSEFQIDSDTEKSEVYHTAAEDQSDKNQKASCTICKRTFRNEKVLEKHYTTSTHIMKVQRKRRGIARYRDKKVVNALPDDKVPKESSPSPILDETKVFRTKGALKTFDHILDVPMAVEKETAEEIKPVEPSLKLDLHANDDKLYYEFKMEKKPEDMTPKDKDQLFDSLFNSLEAKAQEEQISYTPKSNFSTATPQDSEMESTSTSWDLKHDADIEWEADNTDNVPFANAIKERYPKKFPFKINKSKDTAVSIPTKSLIMGKIFKKHREREKQNTPQADAPSNKPGIKNSLDEIFDHLKNSAEIDDKVLTCPSPKTLLKSAGGTFSPNSSNSNDMLETASHSNNNNIYAGKPVRATPETEEKKPNVYVEPLLVDSANEDGEDGIGKRKSRRRCVIRAKTFAETWSSDEYEELHDTEDIISIINEFEKRETIKKRKLARLENHLRAIDAASEVPAKPSSTSMAEKKAVHTVENLPRERADKKKSVQIQFADEIFKPEKAANVIKKRRISEAKDGHKSDEETFTATKDFKPLKPCPSTKKRRMSCFVPSTTSFDERSKPKPQISVKPSKEVLRMESETLKKFEKANESLESKSKTSSVKKSDSEKSFKNQKFVNLLSNFGGQNAAKKKAPKHRKRPRNKVKNIAYDSDSDFELNLNRKSKAPSTFSESSSSEADVNEDKDDVVVAPKAAKSQVVQCASRSSNTNNMTMIKESKLLPNDLKHVVTTANFKAAIPEDIIESSQSACNRTKRHSSEKLYYWSSSSSESDQEQGDTADGDNEDSVMPHQAEQHGWIVGDSHKKLVTLLAHAKIKNKISN